MVDRSSCLQASLDLVSVELHQLTSIDGHLLEDNCHLLLAKGSASLKLVSKRSEDVGIHATEPHVVEVTNRTVGLLVDSLVAEDCQQSSLSPTDIGAKFVLEDFECFLLVHNSNNLQGLAWTDQAEIVFAADRLSTICRAASLRMQTTPAGVG